MKRVVGDLMFWLYLIGTFMVGLAGQLVNLSQQDEGIAAVQWAIAICASGGTAILAVFALYTNSPQLARTQAPRTIRLDPPAESGGFSTARQLVLNTAIFITVLLAGAFVLLSYSGCSISTFAATDRFNDLTGHP